MASFSFKEGCNHTTNKLASSLYNNFQFCGSHTKNAVFNRHLFPKFFVKKERTKVCTHFLTLHLMCRIWNKMMEIWIITQMLV